VGWHAARMAAGGAAVGAAGKQRKGRKALLSFGQRARIQIIQNQAGLKSLWMQGSWPD